MTRLAVATLTVAALGLLCWGADALLKRMVLVIVTLLVLLAGGCALTLPTQPPVRVCYPAKSMYCDTRIQWGIT